MTSLSCLNKLTSEWGSNPRLLTRIRTLYRVSIPPGVAIVDFQYPSFHYSVRGCHTKWNFFLLSIELPRPPNITVWSLVTRIKIDLTSCSPLIIFSDVGLWADLDVGDIGVLVQHMDVVVWRNAKDRIVFTLGCHRGICFVELTRRQLTIIGGMHCRLWHGTQSKEMNLEFTTF